MIVVTFRLDAGHFFPAKNYRLLRTRISRVIPKRFRINQDTMNYIQYQQLFDAVLQGKLTQAPYDNPHYVEYTKLNQSRMNRWNKQLVLDEALVEELKAIRAPQHWIIITEPWCGDASHIVPFLIRMTEQTHLISYDLVLRDTPPLLIESYLTNGTKSIPKLIVRNEGQDLFTWGPRPEAAKELVAKLKAANMDAAAIKVELQRWYNEDKGATLCREITELLKSAKANAA